jgi:hypothetical protein
MSRSVDLGRDLAAALRAASPTSPDGSAGSSA